jgi:hypothetical protein
MSAELVADNSFLRVHKGRDAVATDRLRDTGVDLCRRVATIAFTEPPAALVDGDRSAFRAGEA